jgi:hypothetical protein
LPSRETVTFEGVNQFILIIGSAWTGLFEVEHVYACHAVDVLVYRKRIYVTHAHDQRSLNSSFFRSTRLISTEGPNCSAWQPQLGDALLSAGSPALRINDGLNPDRCNCLSNRRYERNARRDLAEYNRRPVAARAVKDRTRDSLPNGRVNRELHGVKVPVGDLVFRDTGDIQAPRSDERG